GEALWPDGGKLDQAALEFCGALSELVRARAPGSVLLADELGEWPAAAWPTAEHGLALDAAGMDHWADCLASGPAGAGGLLALGIGPQVRALHDWRRREAHPDWARAKMAALTALTAPGWALFGQRDLDDPFPGATQDRAGLAEWRGFLAQAHRLVGREPAFAPSARLRLLAQPAGAAGPIVFAREAQRQAAIVALAPRAGYSGPIPTPFRGEFSIALRTLAGAAGGARSALADLGSPSGYSLEIDMAQNEGLVVLGRAA
ncbi:MAG: hypothetical protein K2P95_07385, partial [Hyphomonadaceae bacterium]|nr:hypothetical protein [Hyphomonadaceae bacterium]